MLVEDVPECQELFDKCQNLICLTQVTIQGFFLSKTDLACFYCFFFFYFFFYLFNVNWWLSACLVSLRPDGVRAVNQTQSLPCQSLEWDSSS